LVLLDHLRSRDRAELYGLFAALLASEPDRADLLVDSLGFLPRHQRGPAASQLLNHSDGSAELHRVITTRLNELPDLDRLQLLLAVVRGSRFTGQVQVACVDAAQAMGGAGGQLALEEILQSTRLAPELRELFIR
jgi:hypothetical protein